jgi:hypothetical protein
MKIGLTERQYRRILSKTTENQEIKEDEEVPAAEPEAGTSAQQSGGQGYPEVGKWESGVSRGPSNQVGITKWADVVGSTLKRDKANKLKETYYTKKEFELVIEQLNPEFKPWYNPSDGKLMSGMMKIGKGGVYAKSLYPNIKDGRYPPIAKVEDIKNFWAPSAFKSPLNPNDRLAVGSINDFANNTTLSDAFAKSTPTYWKGKPQPQKPTPYKGQIISTPGTKLPEQPWGYYEGKLGNLKTQESQYQIDFTNWIKTNDINQYYNMVRKSPKGLDVPKGYSPLEYDEYRSKIDPIVKQIESLSKPKPSARGWMDTGTIPLTKEEQTKLAQLRKQRDDINNEYYDADFPNGISKEQKKQLDLWKNALSQYYKPLIEKEKESTEKSQQSNSKIDNTYVYYPKMSDGIYSMEYNKKLTDLKKVFGYNRDNRSGFDKFWDEWGTVIQIGGGLILTVLIPELGIPLLTMRSMMVADTVFNLAIAAYQTSRDQTENAAGSVIFAILPHLNIFKVPSAIAESISKKVAVAPLKTSSDLAIFMKTMLNEEEAKWLTTILKSDKKTLENATKEITKRFIKTQESLGVKASTKQIQKLETSWLNKGVNKFKKIDPLAKTAPKILEKPIIKKIGFDLGVYFTVTEWINAIEEKAKIKLEEKERKNLEAYFNSVPEEVKEIFTNLSLSQIEKIGDGNVNEALDEFTKEETQINPKTNKPFTTEEWDKVKEDIRNDFPDEKSKLPDEVVDDLEK